MYQGEMHWCVVGTSTWKKGAVIIHMGIALWGKSCLSHGQIFFLWQFMPNSELLSLCTWTHILLKSSIVSLGRGQRFCKMDVNFRKRDLSACYFYKHISNYLLLRCTVKYLFLWTCDACTYFLIFFFIIFTFLALHMCSASKDSGSGVSSGCAGSFSFSRTLQVGRSWPSGKPGPLPASSVPVAALRSAAQLPHSCCRAESLHQLRASGWRCCTHNIANSSSWTPGASLLISFSLILQKCSRHIWNWRCLGTI